MLSLGLCFGFCLGTGLSLSTLTGFLFSLGLGFSLGLSTGLCLGALAGLLFSLSLGFSLCLSTGLCLSTLASLLLGLGLCFSLGLGFCLSFSALTGFLLGLGLSLSFSLSLRYVVYRLSVICNSRRGRNLRLVRLLSLIQIGAVASWLFFFGFLHLISNGVIAILVLGIDENRIIVCWRFLRALLVF